MLLNLIGLSCRQMAELGSRGIRALAVARQDNEDGRWKFLGMLTFLDPPYPDTKQAIEQARLLGVEVRRPPLVRCNPPAFLGGVGWGGVGGSWTDDSDPSERDPR
jgi:hypothetical protein